MSSVQEAGKNVRKLKRKLQSKEGGRRETLVTLCFSEVGRTRGGGGCQNGEVSCVGGSLTRIKACDSH